MSLGVPRHREPSGLHTAPVPHRSSSFFSPASALFPHFSSSKCSTTPLLSATCTLLRKQWRSVSFFRSMDYFPLPPLSPLNAVFTQNAPVTPLESVFTFYVGVVSPLPLSLPKTFGIMPPSNPLGRTHG